MSKFGITKLPSDTLEELALKHQVLRKKMGFSQSEIALRFGVSLGSVKRFEKSRTNFTSITFEVDSYFKSLGRF